MIHEKQDGEDLVWVATDRTNAAAGEQEVLRMNGSTGKLTASSGFGSSQLLSDSWDKEAADTAAGTLTAEHAFYRAASAMTIKAVRYVPDAALTASDTVYATITVDRRNADGTNPVQVAQVLTKVTGGSGNWTQWVAVALTLTGANVGLAAGQILTVSIAKASTGTIVPAGQLVIDYTIN